MTADADGEWVADFSQQGPLGEPAVDLLPTAVALAQQFDGDGNATALWASASPADKDRCKSGGWEDFGTFENQGQCVKAIVAASAGFQDTELELNTGALVDFGFGETDYLAIGTVPARLREDVESVMVTYFVDGLRYAIPIIAVRRQASGPCQEPRIRPATYSVRLVRRVVACQQFVSRSGVGAPVVGKG